MRGTGGRSRLDGASAGRRWLVAAAVCLLALAAPAIASAQSAAPGQVVFPSPANGATVASPVEIVYVHTPACEEDHPAYDTPYGQNMLPPQVVNVVTTKNEMELSPGIGRRIVASPGEVGLDSVYVTAFEYGGTSPIPRQGIPRTERIVMGLPNGTYEVKFTQFIGCAGTSDVLRFTVGAAAAGGGPAPGAGTGPAVRPSPKRLLTPAERAKFEATRRKKLAAADLWERKATEGEVCRRATLLVGGGGKNVAKGPGVLDGVNGAGRSVSSGIRVSPVKKGAFPSGDKGRKPPLKGKFKKVEVKQNPEGTAVPTTENVTAKEADDIRRQEVDLKKPGTFVNLPTDGSAQSLALEPHRPHQVPTPAGLALAAIGKALGGYAAEEACNAGLRGLAAANREHAQRINQILQDDLDARRPKRATAPGSHARHAEIGPLPVVTVAPGPTVGPVAAQALSAHLSNLRQQGAVLARLRLELRSLARSRSASARGAARARAAELASHLARLATDESALRRATIEAFTPQPGAAVIAVIYSRTPLIFTLGQVARHPLNGQAAGAAARAATALARALG